MNPISALLAALAGLTAIFVAAWTRAVLAARHAQTGDTNPATDARFPTSTQIGLGAVTNFFDTLGIGSFATTTAIFRLWKMVPDRIIPGTLNVGHTLPTIAQAFIFTARIPVDIADAVLHDCGGGARRVARRWHRAMASPERCRSGWAWRCWPPRRFFSWR